MNLRMDLCFKLYYSHGVGDVKVWHPVSRGARVVSCQASSLAQAAMSRRCDRWHVTRDTVTQLWPLTAAWHSTDVTPANKHKQLYNIYEGDQQWNTLVDKMHADFYAIIYSLSVQNHFLDICIISLFTCSLSIVSEGPDSPEADDVDRGWRIGEMFAESSKQSLSWLSPNNNAGHCWADMQELFVVQ